LIGSASTTVIRNNSAVASDVTNLIRIIQKVQPDENDPLAAQAHVPVSSEAPEHTANADAIGTVRLLEAIRILKRRDGQVK
jgi:GDPmannose 4,6-dehydratase